MRTKKFALLTLTVLLTAAVFVFAQNGNPFRLATSVPTRTMQLGDNHVKLAPEGLKQKVATSHHASSNRAGAIADLAGNYTWNFGTVSDVGEEVSAEYSYDVTISVSGEELTITGMFDNAVTATIDEYGYLVIDATSAGTTSYGDYDVYGIFYYPGDEEYEEGWYYTDIYATIGTDGVITLDDENYLIAVLSTGNYAGYYLTPLWAPGSTLTPAGSSGEEVGGDGTTYDFEDGTMQGWTTIDADGDGFTWVLGSEVGGVYLVEGATITGHNGSADLVVSASYSNVYGVLTPDNYLVSPKVKLGGSISFYACAQDASWPSEVFGVAVSTKGNTAAADFTMVKNWTMTAVPSAAPAPKSMAKAFRSSRRDQGKWYKYVVDLSDYSGDGYVAIRHYGCSDQFILDVDDIELTSGEAGAGYDLSSVSSYGKVTFTVNGKEVKKAEAGQTVTVTVTPDNGFEVDNITATAYADWDEAQSPQQNIGLLKDIDLTAAGENTWTFVMVGANVEVTVTYKKNVELNLTGGDITAALNEATDGLPLNDLKMTLAEGDYTVSEPITAGGTIEIDGKNATIDASGNSGAFIVLEGTNELAKKEDGTDSDHKLVNLVEVSGLTITDMTGSFIKDNQKTLLEQLIIDDCVIQMPASNKNFIDFNGKGYIGEVKVKNSTIWASGKNTGFFAQYGSRPKNVNGNLLQAFDVQNSDIINIANGKNFCDLKQNGTAQNVYTLKNSIFVDCGKNGQTVVGFNKGQNSATPQWDVTGNYFEWGGVCTNDAEISKAGQKDGEDIVQDCVYGAPDFADAANGDFTLGETSELLHSRTGDPRWFGNNLQPIGGGQATDPIEVVPVTKSDPANPIDLSLLLKGELEFSPNPASITFKLRPDEHYIVSEPLTVGTRITIMTDGEDPANIDCSMLNGPMVQMDNYRSLLPADENGFIPVNNVTFQNILVRNLKYGLFSTQRARYIIDYLTIDNCILYADSQIDFLDFTNGGVLQELNIINSTLANRGAGLAQIYNAENSNNPVDADVKVQKLNINNSTLSKVKGFTHPAASTAELQIKVLNNVVAASPNFCVSLNGDQNTVVQFNAFANPVAWTMIEDDEVWVGKDYRLSEPLATGSIEGDVIFLNNFDNQLDFSLGECAAKEAEVGDPRWLIARMYVTLGLIEYAKRDLSWIVNEGLKKGFNMFILPEPADDDPYLYLKTLKSINVDKPLYIKSNPKIRVFAGLNADPFIVLSDEPAVKKINDYWRLNLIRLRGLWVICMRNSIIWDNKQKYCVENLKIDDCVLSMTPLPGDLDGMPERLRTKECKFESHIAFEQGGVKDFSIINSTVCDNKDKAVAKYFIRYNNSARLDRYGYDKDKDFQTMTYKNNTFYGMLNADGQWGNYNGISGQKYSKFDIEKNIWYNCGKEIIRRLAGGRFGDGAPVKFYQNTYVNDGEILDESGYDKSETQLNSMPKFKFEVTQVYTPDYFHYDDYTLCTSSEQLFYKTGDPRWVENGGFADGYHWDPKLGKAVADSRTGDTDAIEVVETNKADGEWYTIQGVRVDKPTKGLFIHNGRKVVIK